MAKKLNFVKSVPETKKKIVQNFYFSIFSFVLISMEKMYQTIKTLFDHIIPNKKYSLYRTHIFTSLLDAWKCDQTQPFMFDMQLISECQRLHT